MPLKILHLNTERTLRGGEIQMLMLAAELQARGHENVLILQKNSASISEAQQKNLPYRELAMRGEWDVLAVGRLRSFMREQTPHILHAHTSHAGTLALLARSTRRNPAIVLSRRVSAPLKKNPLSLYKYRKVDAILAVSSVIQTNLATDSLQASRVLVAESATDFARFQQAPSKEKAHNFLEIPLNAFVIGNVSHFEKQKGQLLLIQAFAQLVRRSPSVLYHLILVGDGPGLQECKHFANRLNLSDRILFPGYRTDVENYYAAMDLFFLSSLPGAFEGLSGGVREAMAAGLPVVAVRQPALAEQIQDGQTGMFVAFDQLAEWVEAIEKLRNDPDLRQRLAANGKISVQKFTIENLANKTEACYRAVLGDQILADNPL